MEWKTTRLVFSNKTPLFYCVSFFFFFSVCALFPTLKTSAACLDIKSPLTGQSDLHFQDFEKTRENIKDEGGMMVSIICMRDVSLSLTRRYLTGPGSWPPRCTSKCGSCRPCKPVHVSVPPGRPVTAEYYPEAWRCKCGNRLYMP